MNFAPSDLRRVLNLDFLNWDMWHELYDEYDHIMMKYIFTTQHKVRERKFTYKGKHFWTIFMLICIATFNDHKVNKDNFPYVTIYCNQHFVFYFISTIMLLKRLYNYIKDCEKIWKVLKYYFDISLSSCSCCLLISIFIWGFTYESL